MKLSKVGKTSQKCAWTAVATRASSKKFVNFRLGSSTTVKFMNFIAVQLKFMNFVYHFSRARRAWGGVVKDHELYRKVHELYAKVHEP